MVMIDRGGSYNVRAVIDRVMSRSDRIEPPCAVPQLVMNSGRTVMERRATPFSSASTLMPRCSEKGMFFVNA